jgi:hypothetical protein
MGTADASTLARTRAIVTDAARGLRWPVRRTRILQKLRRWTGQAHFLLQQQSKKPTEVHTADIGIPPLWHSDQRGPDDLDLLHPTMVTRRYTLGLTWTISHVEDDFRAVIVLVVDSAERPWLVSPDHQRFPATPSGWRDLVTEIARTFSGYSGGRWQGSG